MKGKRNEKLNKDLKIKLKINLARKTTFFNLQNFTGKKR